MRYLAFVFFMFFSFDAFASKCECSLKNSLLERPFVFYTSLGIPEGLELGPEYTFKELVAAGLSIGLVPSEPLSLNYTLGGSLKYYPLSHFFPTRHFRPHLSYKILQYRHLATLKVPSLFEEDKIFSKMWSHSFRGGFEYRTEKKIFSLSIGATHLGHLKRWRPSGILQFGITFF